MKSQKPQQAPSPQKPIKAVLYARVSTEEQKRKETIQAQRTAAQGWSQRTGIPIQRVYAEGA